MPNHSFYSIECKKTTVEVYKQSHHFEIETLTTDKQEKKTSNKNLANFISTKIKQKHQNLRIIVLLEPVSALNSSWTRSNNLRYVIRTMLI